jgi:hypothetical protein
MGKQPSLFLTEKNFCIVVTGMGLSYRSQLKIQSISKRSINQILFKLNKHDLLLNVTNFL